VVVVVELLGSVLVGVLLFDELLAFFGVVVVVVLVEVVGDAALRAAWAAAISWFMAAMSLWYVPNEPAASAA